jgi:hypothetical protein
MSKSSFGKLKNSELVFINFIMRDVLKSYTQIIEEKGISNRLTLPDGSFLESFKSLSPEDLKEINDSKRFTHILNINEKLENVTSLIKDSFPAIYEEIEDLFSQDDEDSDQTLL